MFSNYGYFRTGSDQYIGAIASEKLLRWVKAKEYNTLEIVKVKILLPQKS
jgi:hypothetical protein